MVNTFTIADRPIGGEAPCFLIAEAGVNHNGDLKLALELVDVAAQSGAYAIKFKTFKAERLVTADAVKADYQKANTDGNESQFEMLKRLELSEDDHRALIKRCSDCGILFMSTPFEEQSADFLHSVNVPVFKIPSGEMTNLPFLGHVAAMNRPMVVSTGMCSLGEVESAVRTIEATGNRQFALLHCVSSYPAAPCDVNLRAMRSLAAAFQVPVGYSDHTVGCEVAVAAVAMGASVLEKHYTLDRNLPGPDHAASLEPNELTELVRQIRTVEQALGNGRKQLVASEANTAEVARKSLVTSIDVLAGTRLTDLHIAVRRPGTGMPPSMKPHFLNRTAREMIPAGTVLNLEMVE
jgi:N,N'-diacetyllegionaminate synthase